jgi:hypothetical protein
MTKIAKTISGSTTIKSVDDFYNFLNGIITKYGSGFTICFNDLQVPQSLYYWDKESLVNDDGFVFFNLTDKSEKEDPYCNVYIVDLIREIESSQVSRQTFLFFHLEGTDKLYYVNPNYLIDEKYGRITMHVTSY